MKVSKKKAAARWIVTIVGYALITISVGLPVTIGVLCIHLALVFEIIDVIERTDKNEKSNF